MYLIRDNVNSKKKLQNTPKYRYTVLLEPLSHVKARPSPARLPSTIYVWGGGCNRISQSSASGQVDDPAAPSGESRNEILELQVVKFYKINISGRVAIFGTSRTAYAYL